MIYKTIAYNSEGLYKEKGSKFLAFAYPVDSVDKAKEKIDELRIAHPKAVHHCYAWRIGIETLQDRYSDDGEPNNSAGMPIFGQIRAFEITNVLIVVVRYYGGTKLGVGGLISAYKKAAKDALEIAVIIEKHEEVRIGIKFDPNHTSELMRTLSKLNLSIDFHGFKDNLSSIEVVVKKSQLKEIITIFANTNLYKIEEL
jgi:uncharacterized YigZ family protein